MKLYNMNGKRIYIYGTPLARAGDGPFVDETVGRPAGGTIPDVDRMTMKTLKGYLCEGAPCAGCEVMCGFGKRYLALRKAEE